MKTKEKETVREKTELVRINNSHEKKNFKSNESKQ